MLVVVVVVVVVVAVVVSGEDRDLAVCLRPSPRAAFKGAKPFTSSFQLCIYIYI